MTTTIDRLHTPALMTRASAEKCSESNAKDDPDWTYKLVEVSVRPVTGPSGLLGCEVGRWFVVDVHDEDGIYVGTL